LIDRNTTIPTKKSQVFSTADDNQSAVTIRVLQGEREMAADNKLMGNFNLEGIPPAPRGVPQVEVTFDIDANGIVNVSAKDKATNKEQKITIQSSGGLTEDEIKQMVKDAEANAAVDKQRRESVETKNQAEGLVHATEKQLVEHGAAISAEVKSGIESAIKDLKTALEKDDTAAIKEKSQALAAAAMKMGEEIYSKGQTPEGGPDAAGAAGAGGSDDVVDADFEEVKDDKKSA
ncbi:MAG TPA: Hsp70 family protein, partial [Hyphomonadaceae bacterium]|nr:Hsp70 family protein [Hyphomonadaceae bacterium]